MNGTEFLTEKPTAMFLPIWAFYLFRILPLYKSAYPGVMKQKFLISKPMLFRKAEEKNERVKKGG